MTSVERYTAGAYLDLNPTWHIEDSPWKAEQIMTMIRRAKLAPERVCEIGCGAGEILSQLQGMMPGDVSFEGFDISPQAYDLCQRRENDRLTCRLGTVSEHPDDPFDLMLVVDVVEHVEDPFSFLRQLRGRAQFAMFHFPMDFCVYTALRQEALMRGRAHMGHIHYFNRATALAILRDTGYTVVDAFHTSAAGDPRRLPPRSFGERALRMTRRMAWRVHPGLSAQLLGGSGLLVLAR